MKGTVNAPNKLDTDAKAKQGQATSKTVVRKASDSVPRSTTKALAARDAATRAKGKPVGNTRDARALRRSRAPKALRKREGARVRARKFFRSGIVRELLLVGMLFTLLWMISPAAACYVMAGYLLHWMFNA